MMRTMFTAAKWPLWLLYERCEKLDCEYMLLPSRAYITYYTQLSLYKQLDRTSSSTNNFSHLCFRTRSTFVYLTLEKVNIIIEKKGNVWVGMNLWAFSRHRLMWLTSHGPRSQSTLSNSSTTWFFSELPLALSFHFPPIYAACSRDTILRMPTLCFHVNSSVFHRHWSSTVFPLAWGNRLG